MPHYLVLVRYTQQGVEKFKESPARLQAARKLLAEKGCRLKEFYMALGHYDAVNILEAPDDATLAKVTLAVTAKGNARTETLRLFTEDEYKEIVDSLP